MVEISRTSPLKRSIEASRKKKKPVWLLAAYGLFFLSCFNAFRTYQNQKELVRLKVEQQREADEKAETRYSAGAEENVVTAGVGSSQYGGSVRARDSTKKKRKNLGENFLGIRPEPSDGSKDYSRTHPSSDFKGFRFYVMAGTSDTESIDERLQPQLAVLRNFTKHNPEDIPFGIHLGGTEKYNYCNESIYEHRANMLSQMPSPTFVTPGQGDWFDCPNQEEAFGFFTKHLGHDLAEKWSVDQTAILNIERSERNPELFRFLFDGILVIGLHVVDPPKNDEFVATRQKRMQTSLEWLAESVESMFEQHEIRGAIIVGHAGKSELNERFFSKAKKYFSTGRNDIPVLYLFGNHLEFEVDKNSSPFYYVQMSPSKMLAPSFIDVAPQKNGKIKSLHAQEGRVQTILGKNMYRIDQQGGQLDTAETP